MTSQPPEPGPDTGERSDVRLRERVCEALTNDDAIDATGIEVAVQDGEVTLTGFVTDPWTEQAAETFVANQSGVAGVINHLHVKRDEETHGQQLRKALSEADSASG